MVDFQQVLQHARVLELLPLLSADASCHLVGGALRNGLLHRESFDFDFTTPGDPTPLAKAFCRAIGGTWFLLDRSRNQSRVLCSIKSQQISYDFAPWRAPTLDEDLRSRDFTVNAMAWPVQKIFNWNQVLDPCNGRLDLMNRTLRHCSTQVFEDDPLRILRGVRLSNQLQMNLDPASIKLMREASANIKRVAAERVRQELAAIFASDPISPGLRQLQDLGVLEEHLGVSHTDTFPLALFAATEIQQGWNNLPKNYDQFGLDGASMLVDGFSRAAFFNLAALLRASRKGQGGTKVVSVWRWSRKAERLLQDLLALPDDLISRLASLPANPRGQALWIAGLGTLPQEILSFMALSCRAEPTVAPTLSTAWKAYCEKVENRRIPELVPVEWIQTNLRWAIGPLLGQCLEQVRQAELKGLVSTRAEGENLLKSIGEKYIDK